MRDECRETDPYEEPNTVRIVNPGVDKGRKKERSIEGWWEGEKLDLVADLVVSRQERSDHGLAGRGVRTSCP